MTEWYEARSGGAVTADVERTWADLTDGMTAVGPAPDETIATASLSGLGEE